MATAAAAAPAAAGRPGCGVVHGSPRVSARSPSAPVPRQASVEVVRHEARVIRSSSSAQALSGWFDSAVNQSYVRCAWDHRSRSVLLRPSLRQATRGALMSRRTTTGALIDAVRGGDLHAYGALYERHVGAAGVSPRRLCSNRADVDDVVGDVFTNTLRAITCRARPARRPSFVRADRHSQHREQARRPAAIRAGLVPTADDQLDASRRSRSVPLARDRSDMRSCSCRIASGTCSG